MSEKSNVVHLLYALYPCRDWWRGDRHGATSQCDCVEQFEGVFASPEGAKTYIAEYVNEHHINLSWEVEDLTGSCGYRHEYAQAEESGKPMIWHIQKYDVYD